MKQIFIAGYILAFIFIFIQVREIRKYRDLSQLQAVELSTLNDSVAQYRTKTGELYGKIKSVEVEKSTIKDALEVAGYDIKELKEKDIRWRKLVSALRLELEAKGEGKTSVTDTFRIVKDSIIYYQLVEDWNNGHLYLFDAKIENKELDFSYRYNIGVEIFQTEHRKHTEVTFSLTDPNAQVVTANSVNVPHKKTSFWKKLIYFGSGFASGLFLSQ